ncbi:MAG TPA: TolC family protein [Armatimonadota bacterium]|jgi:outer membrane protein
MSTITRKALLAVSLLGLTAGMALAADPPAAPVVPAPAPAVSSPLELTPLQAGEAAVLESLDVRQAEEAVRQAQARQAQAQVGNQPTASIAAQLGVTGPVTKVTFNNQTISVGTPQVEQVVIQVAVPVYTGGRVEWAVRAAAAGVKASRTELEVTRRAIREAALEAAYGVLRASELAGVADRQVTSNQAHLRIAEAMLNAGTVAQFEVIQAQTALSQAIGAQIAARTAVDQALAQLRQILQLPQTFPLQIVSPVAPTQRPAGGLADLIEQSWTQRPELTAAGFQVRRAEAGISLARASDAISMSLGASTSRGMPSTFTTGESWQVVLSINQPLLDGGAKRAALADAQSLLRSAQIALESQRQQIALQVTQQYLALDQATQQLQVAVQGVVEARERLRVANVRFGAGVTNGVEVLDAEVALTAAEVSEVNANYDVQTALYRLQQALGQPLQAEAAK